MALQDPRYADNALTANSTSHEIEAGSVNLSEEHLTEQPESGNKFQPDSDITTSIRNVIDFTLYQPVFNTPALLTNFKVNWKEYDANGVAPSTGIIKTFTKGTIIPVSFNAEKGSLAKFAKKVYSLFNAGNSITDSSGIDTPATVTDPYKLNSVTIGGTAVKSVRSASGNYNHSVEWPPELEPEEVWVSKSPVSGSITTDDLSEATVERLTTGEVADIVVGFVSDSGSTTNLTFTNCSIRATINGSQVTLDWKKLTD